MIPDWLTILTLVIIADIVILQAIEELCTWLITKKLDVHSAWYGRLITVRFYITNVKIFTSIPLFLTAMAIFSIVIRNAH